jgi:hypothetical protein
MQARLLCMLLLPPRRTGEKGQDIHTCKENNSPFSGSFLLSSSVKFRLAGRAPWPRH